MTLSYAVSLSERLSFTQDEVAFLRQASQRLEKAGQEPVLQQTYMVFEGSDFSIEKITPSIGEAAKAAGISVHTVWLLFLLMAAEPAEHRYEQKGIDRQVFLDTFGDLRYKCDECRQVKGVYGTFVQFWYPIFYRLNIFKLGRLEYENIAYPKKAPYRYTDGSQTVTITPGQMVRTIHIPSSHEPFDDAARLASYARAQAFFDDAPTGARLCGGPLLCWCHSWLLYPGIADVWPEKSHVRGFIRDFDIIDSSSDREYGDTWRVFGAAASGPVRDFPEETSMQRRLKEYYLHGGLSGEGFGVLIFDKGKILNR